MRARLWTTASAFTLMLSAASERWYFAGFSKSQEARKARFNQLRILDTLAAFLPVSVVRRNLLIKDLKVFLRDVTQWSQLLLLLALVVMYLYNFQVLDLDRIPYMAGFVKNFLRVPQPGARGVRHGDRRGSVRVSSGLVGRRGVLDSSEPRRSPTATSCGRSSGRASCRCC
jgi:hypothetical protein